MKHIDIESALHLAFEIEGLILLVKQREENLPHEANSLLASKSAALASMFNECAAEDEVQTASQHAPENKPEKRPIETEETSVADTITGPTVRVEDKLAVAAGKGDLRKSLTINDRYLFCRELFDMSNNVLNRTLETVGRMESFEQAREYLLDTLELDTKNPATDYFLSFISRHFKK